jgi:hypothetical protein
MIFVVYGLGFTLILLSGLRAWVAFRIFLAGAGNGRSGAAVRLFGRGLLSAVGLALVGVEILLISTHPGELPLWPIMTGLICLLTASAWSALDRGARPTS